MKHRGLFQKYEVKKLTNPAKDMDCIVLEFDDPISRVGIKSFADECKENGYIQLAKDIEEHLEETK